MNLSVVLDKKKFRFHDNKAGVLLGMRTLQSDYVGTLEQCGGRGINKVICAIQLANITVNSTHLRKAKLLPHLVPM